MKKILIVLSILISALAPQVRSEDALPSDLQAKDFFINLPFPIIEILDRNSRMNMLDYYEADSIAPVRNGLGGYSVLEKVTPDYLKVRMTPVSTIAIKVLPYKGKKIAAVVTTVGDSLTAYDSRIAFVDESFKTLKASNFISALTNRSLFNSNKDFQTALQMMDLFTQKITLLPETDYIYAECTTPQAVGKEDAEKLKPLLKQKVWFQWNGKKFVKRNVDTKNFVITTK